MLKLKLKAFFFNAQTDYLPYYKHFTIQVSEESGVVSILEEISKQNDTFSYPKEKPLFKINDLVVEGSTPVQAIVERLGTTLQIDSVNSYRSTHGLVIDDSDFMESFTLLAPYASEEDKAYYQTLYALHYASETSNFVRDYKGDAILVLAHKMITEGSEHKEAILEAISPTLQSCEYDNNLFETQEHTQTIESLKAMLQPEEEKTLLKVIKQKLNIQNKTPTITKKEHRDHKVIHKLEDKRITYYPADTQKSISKDIHFIGAKEIFFSKASKRSGISLLKENKTLALTKAGTILLDAFDAGAEVIVIEDRAIHMMFEKHFKSIEKLMGRKMLGLEVLLEEDFKSQCDMLIA